MSKMICILQLILYRTHALPNRHKHIGPFKKLTSCSTHRTALPTKNIYHPNAIVFILNRSTICQCRIPPNANISASKQYLLSNNKSARHKSYKNIHRIYFTINTNIHKAIMSSPLTKHGNDSSSNKPRKIKTTNSVKSSSNLDSRTELADLIKRKAEISVSTTIQLLANKYFH